MNYNLVPTGNYEGPINIGDYVKLGFGANLRSTEHIWLSVSDAGLTQFTGMVESELAVITDVCVGDVISFSRRHVLQRATDKQMQMFAGVLLKQQLESIVTNVETD